MPRIVLVDDDRSHMMSLSMMLEAEGFEVECHSDGLAAWESLSKSLPDILVLDVKLPGLDGMDVVQRLRHVSNIPVMFCTTKEDEIDEVLGLRMGADDYVKKPFSQRILLERIRALLRRSGRVASKGMLNYADLAMDQDAHRVTRAGRPLHLGPTEYRLLEFFLQHPGRVFAREQLLDAVWGRDIHVEPRTVDVHIRRLRKAINQDQEVDLIRTVRSAGYALDSDPDRLG